MGGRGAWPADPVSLAAAQGALAEAAAAALLASPYRPGRRVLVGGCFVAAAGPRTPNEPWRCAAWAAAVTWRTGGVPGVPRHRRSDDALRGSTGVPRRARDLEGQVVVAGTLVAPYVPGLLALRHGPLLADAVASLAIPPDVLLVDATGLDHPRGAGLAVHLGALLGVPTVGVTDRPLVAHGEAPGPRRGERSPVRLAGEVVGYWVRTRDRTRPVLAHGAWRSAPETAAEVVLLSSTGAARTPVPLEEARRVAREARSAALGASRH